ncbi:MAG: sialate O-acetylesterase, partial [bacterium]
MVRRLLSYVVVGGIVFVSAMAPHAPVRPTLPRQLFLLVGQSNMAGRGIVEEVDRVAVDRVVMQDRSLHWIPAVEPVHYDKPGVVGVGPGRAFGVAVAARWSGVEIGLVPAAVGGTSIRAWAPGAADVATHTHPYDDAIGRARAALTDGQLAGILWLQGESDGNADAAADYESRLRDVIAHFRRDLDAPDVPFLIAQLGRFAGSPWNEFRSRVDSAQQRVAATTARVAFVPTDGLRDRGDTVHFDAPSAREIGR